MSSGNFNTQFGNLTKIRAEDVLSTRNLSDYACRRTKIVCTMGPACWDVDKLVEMIDAGMDIARLNFSHGDHETHGRTVQNLREAMKHRPHRKIALMLDTKGPEIRTGLLKDGKNIDLVQGQELKITTDYSHVGDSTCISCSYPSLPTSVKPGNVILMADGSVSCEVVSCGSNFVIAKVLNNATVGERKNMNLPGVKVDLPCCGEKEIHDIVNFGIPMGCHFVAASFVQTADDVKTIRNVLGTKGRHIKIIPKIENVEGIVNFDEILAVSDGIMVARGDMGMEIPPEKVFLAQKLMIAKCNVAGKPVITATQMLESMIKAPRPTRAEASDVANAVLDGTDCVMLSGESANGQFPVNAVSVLAKTCLEAESCLDYHSIFRAIHEASLAQLNSPNAKLCIPEAVAASAVETAEDVAASLIVALTETGQTAKLIAKYRPKQLIFALSASESTILHLGMVRGIIPVLVNSYQGTDSVLNSAILEAKRRDLVKTGDNVVCVHGIMEEVAGQSNLLKVLTVE